MRAFACLLVTCAAVLIGMSHTVSAQEDVLFLDPAVEIDFGQELRFSLRADNADTVESIALFLQPEMSSNVYQVDVPFTPASDLSIVVTVPVSALDLVPYRDLNYGWELQTADGMRRVPPQSIAYNDHRYTWQSLSQDGLTAHWSGESPFYGENVLQIAENTLQALRPLVPLEQLLPLDIYVYPSSAELRAGRELVGTKGEESALQQAGVVLVTAVNPQSATEELRRSLPLGVTDLVLQHAVANVGETLPWWLRTGIAGYVQDHADPAAAATLRTALAADQTLPLRSLCDSAGPDGEALLLATAQSVAIIDFLVAARGAESISRLVAAQAEGAGCEAGVQQALGWSLDDLHQRWLVAAQPQSKAAAFWSNYGIWIVLLLGSSLVAWLVYRSTRNVEYER